MAVLYEEFPTWEDLIKDILEEDGYDPFERLPGFPENVYWVLDNQFTTDKHGKKIDDWIFLKYTIKKNPETNNTYVKYTTLPGYPTLEEALEAKLFDGESIHDLYNRGYDWLMRDESLEYDK